MASSFDNLKTKYDLEREKTTLANLEKQLSTAHTTPGTDIGQLSSQLSYYSNLVTLITELFSAIDQHSQAQQLLSATEPELKQLASTELDRLDQLIPTLHQQLRKIQIAHRFSDPDDSRSAILEIRAGAGGEEAALFAADLFRMYSNFSNSNNWKVEIMDQSLSDNGGYKEIIAHISGKDVYRLLKYESGVHRVQRIPATESGGRIHTSTATVAILPEARDIEVEIKPEQIRIDVMRATGAGGQNVNRTDSAVRITHLPTGIVVSCQETKHQLQNREKAMKMLRARLYDFQREQERQKRADMRSSQVGGAMRAEKIRTYNYPQSRITDHRVKLSWHNLDEILNGSLTEMIDQIHTAILDQLLAKTDPTA